MEHKGLEKGKQACGAGAWGSWARVRRDHAGMAGCGQTVICLTQQAAGKSSLSGREMHFYLYLGAC